MTPGTVPFLVGGIAVALFVLVHLFGGRLRMLGGIPRSRWLSAAGGASVAYVFIHLLPELAEWQAELAHAADAAGFEHHAYVIALCGLALFYGLERAAIRSRETTEETADETVDETASEGVFWLHIISFSVYNLLIGYMILHRDEREPVGIVLYAVAMALHFLVNDFGLRSHYKRRYDSTGRWILAGSIAAGWAAGLTVHLPESVLAGVFAFISGGVVLNVLKEELPEERESRFSAFAIGAAAYAVLLLAAT